MEYEQFARRLRLRYLFRNEDNNSFIAKFHIPKPSWQPPSAPATIEEYLRKTRILLQDTLEKNKPRLQYYRPWNINFQQRHFLKTIKENKNIIIKPADKNLGLTILDRSWYDNELLRQLSDVKTYRKIPKDQVPTKKIYEDIKKLLQPEKDRIPSAEYKFMLTKITPETSILPRIYILPKVHKPILSGRPIVPSHSWITTAVSIWLDHQLQPLVRTIPTVIADSKTLINTLKDLRIKNRQCWLITADVSSLYTEIPTQTGISFMKLFLSEHKNQIDDHTADLIIKLLTLVLHNNYLEFNEEVYHQIKGTAMGTPVAVVFANVFMYILERKVTSRFAKQGVLALYRRFLDDIFAITTEDPTDFIKTLSTMHPNIKLDVKISQVSADFLDLHIFKGSQFMETGILDTSVHQKALNAYLYIPWSSWHPDRTKAAFITTELKRYVRNSSSIKNYLTLKRIFWSRLRARGYPPKFLENIFSKVKYADRTQLLQNVRQRDPYKLNQDQPGKSSRSGSEAVPKIFFTTRYTPLTRILPLKDILKTYLPHSCPYRPVLSFAKSPNLHNILCGNKT